LKESGQLPEILKACSHIETVERLRLSSIEPTDVRPELIEVMQTIKKCCPHLHIPLQSGDDEILKRMNRRYDRSFYLELIHQLRSKLPHFMLTLDVMAGFPGETESQFQNTLTLLDQIKPLKCHVFPYSKREGTRAFGYQEVPSSLIRDRVNRLIAHANKLGTSIRTSSLGQCVDVLVEKKKGQNDLLQGTTSNFLKVCFKGVPNWVGKILPVQLLSLEGDLFLGKVAEEG